MAPPGCNWAVAWRFFSGRALPSVEEALFTRRRMKGLKARTYLHLTQAVLPNSPILHIILSLS
jgi:hypothetical protein